MEFKHDAEKVFERLAAWWNHELLDRVCIAVITPKRDYKIREIPTPPTLEEKWTNIDYQVELRTEQMAATSFMGDALPVMRAALGPNFLSATLGCKLNFLPDTTWTEPIIEDWATFAGFPDYQASRWYKLSVAMTERITAEAKNRFIAQMPDLHGGGDALAALRGNESFMMDFYDAPERVRDARRQIDRIFCEMVDTYYKITTSHGQTGSTGFLTWGPGKTFPVQDDTLALVSPLTAREFLLPGISAQARQLDHAMMHLDGPEALDKLDMLLELPEIHGIQWQPGAAHREMAQWIPLMLRILRAGKLLYCNCSPHEVEPILNAVPARGLHLVVRAIDEEEGRKVLNMATRLTR